MGLLGLGAVSVTSDWIELQTLAKVGWGGVRLDSVPQEYTRMDWAT